MKKTSTAADIASAMVRLNTQGLQVPVRLEELKKLPIIPGTGARLKKKNLTDLGPVQNYLSLNETPVVEEDSEDQGDPRHLQNMRDTANSSMHYGSTNLNNTADEDTTTVFDLVHRGRQRQQHFRELQKQSVDGRHVQSPKILSPVSVQPHRTCLARDAPPSGVGLMANSSQNYLLGRKHLSYNYRSVSGGNKHKHYVRSKDKKRAIREFNKEVQSAVLPDIGSALTTFTNRAAKFENAAHAQERNEADGCHNIELHLKDKKHIEYIHEEYYDTKTKGKWTIFNKHAVEVEPE